MASGTLLTSYLSSSGDEVLYLKPIYTYEICVYTIKKGLMEMNYCSKKYSLDPISIKENAKYVKRGKVTIMTTIELIGAPKKYLIENGFKPVPIKEIKEKFKQTKKRKKHEKEKS